MIRDSLEYRAIADHYGARTAQRSGVPLILHIDQGLAILRMVAASHRAMRAFCLHPLLQSDEDLARNFGRLDELTSDVHIAALALEYRHIANTTLSTRAISSAADIPLSPLDEVNQMLIADKVQNRRDFLEHHAASHPRAKELARYFELWLERLGISETRYAELAAAIG